MTFEQLNDVIAVVENETFLEAAECRNISQSTLSKKIMKLERELDITLFDRSRRKASLTEAGSVFYQEALRLTECYAGMLSKLEPYRKNKKQKLCIGTLPILTQYDLTARLKSFTETYPQIDFSFEEAEEAELLVGLRQKKYDYIIARENLFSKLGCVSYPFTEDELVAILPENHRLAGGPFVRLSESCRRAVYFHELLYICISALYPAAERGRNYAGNYTDRKSGIDHQRSGGGEGVSLLAKSNFRIFQADKVKVLPAGSAADDISSPRKTCRYHRDRGYEEFC